MIDLLIGNFLGTSHGGAVTILTGGSVGYRVLLHDRDQRTLLGYDSGGVVQLHIQTLICEDAFDLYGFLSRDDHEAFCDLCALGGLGPVKARRILSTVRADELRAMVRRADIKALSALHGVGAKTAELIVKEMPTTAGAKR